MVLYKCPKILFHYAVPNLECSTWGRDRNLTLTLESCSWMVPLDFDGRNVHQSFIGLALARWIVFDSRPRARSLASLPCASTLVPQYPRARPVCLFHNRESSCKGCTIYRASSILAMDKKVILMFSSRRQYSTVRSANSVLYRRALLEDCFDALLHEDARRCEIPIKSGVVRHSHLVARYRECSPMLYSSGHSPSTLSFDSVLRLCIGVGRMS